MYDLNDFFYFHAVVTHQGFSAAARQVGVPKATLSKGVARLEDRLQVRLLERSTRRLRTTEVGREFYEQCQAMLAGAEAAEAVVAQAQAEPYGIVRMSCPQGLIQDMMADILPRFMRICPKVRVQLKVLNRRADLIEDGVDIALRAWTPLDAEASLITRSLGPTQMVLAMSPELRRTVADKLTVERLSELPTLSMAEDSDDDSWELIGPGGQTRTIRHRPRLFCSNFDMLRAATVQGVGVALLPEHICWPCFESGELLHVLPEWHTQPGIIHVVFNTRKSLLPGVRALIDHLAREITKKVSEPHMDRLDEMSGAAALIDHHAAE
jgi:DNA-binding transcriptional LysR family regulator